MNGYQKLKRQLLPLIKGLPVIFIMFFGGIFIARTIVKYSPNVYQSIAKIKLDDQKFGVSNNYMYKDFEMFSVENKIEAEAELLKSPLLIGMALDSLNLRVQFSRIGSLKKVKLYEDCPFRAKYNISTETFQNQLYEMEVISSKNFILYDLPKKNKKLYGSFGKDLKLKGGSILIEKNLGRIQELQLDLIGKYEVKLFSKDALIQEISNNLDVTAVDKEIPIIRIVYKDENPQKVADLINTLCQTYIEDYITTKSRAAKQTVEFIDSKLSTISTDLSHSESNLESFKQVNDVVNTLQETETGLREISKLKIELINMEMNEKALRELESYISQGNYFDETAINFGFGDLLMTELVKKLKVLYDERHDLLVKYTEQSEQIKVVDRKIQEIKRYIKEAIRQNLKEINIKKADYERVVEEESHMFDGLPTREKNQHILERDFRINEDVYNFLMQKKMDASILASSMISFHRIIQPAVPALEPISPNRTLLTFVFGLLGLIIGISLIYFRQFTRARVLSREDIEKNTTIPFLGVIRHANTSSDFQTLVKSLHLKHSFENLCISINSTLSGEGRSYVCLNLANTFVQNGKTVCVISYSFNSKQKVENWDLETPQKPSLSIFEIGLNEEFNQENIQTLQKYFDIVLIDTPPTANEVNGIEAMRLASVVLFVVRANHTCLNYLSEPDSIKEEFDIKNMYMIMNDAHKATNYSGNYVGSRFDSRRSKSYGFLAKFKQVYQLYFK